MANTFFGFDASLNGENLGRHDEVDGLESGEEEYDLYNDETFGALEDVSNLDDWEQQHEQFAENEEKNKKSDSIESSINQLMLDEDEFTQIFDDVNNFFKDSDIQRDLEENSSPKHTSQFKNSFSVKLPDVKFPPPPTMLIQNSSLPSNIQTVEELERSLLKSRNTNNQALTSSAPPLMPPGLAQGPPQIPLPMHMNRGNVFQHTNLPPPRLPPGLPHPIGMPQQFRSQMPPPNVPQGLLGVVPPPHFLRGAPMGNMPPHPPPGLVHPANTSQYPIHHQYHMQQLHKNQHIPYQHQHPHVNNHHMHQKPYLDGNSNNFRQKYEANEVKDEYAGLMSNREKQWLLNIQLLQLNTGTPYFDDYYYTVFKERKAKTEKENQPVIERNHRFQGNNRQHGHRNNEMQENTNQLTPRIYTPLQFENSLGKLQCGSVTAPRKIIDMDVFALEKEADNSGTPRDTRKTKQLLLELEALYSMLLKAEDLKNPLALSNMDKLRQLKQKQRLRELETASTSEQKQDILKLLQKESIPIEENQEDYLVKIIGSFLNDEKFNSFMNIRKGKLLLVRILPLLTPEKFLAQLHDLWLKVLLSLPIIGRRDTAGDNVLSRLHPYFKRYIQMCEFTHILEITNSLIEVSRPDNNRGTPLSLGRTPLSFVVQNKFGISALVTMLAKTEYLFTSRDLLEKHQNEWWNFFSTWADTCLGGLGLTLPLEPISQQTFNKHCNRIQTLTADRKQALEKWIVES